MDAQLNALPTLPAVSRTEGSGDHCSEHPRDRKKPWKNRDISESDYCKTNSLMDRIPAPLLEKPRENRPKSRFFTEVAAAEDVHCSGLETLAEQSSLATRHFRFSVASTADPGGFTAIVLNVSRRRLGGPAGVEPQSPGERIRRCFTLGRVRYNSRRDRSRSGWSRRGTTRDRGSSAPGRVFGFGLKVHNEQYRHPFAADHVPVTLPCNEPGSSPWLTRRRLALTLDPARPSLD